MFVQTGRLEPLFRKFGIQTTTALLLVLCTDPPDLAVRQRRITTYRGGNVNGFDVIATRIFQGSPLISMLRIYNGLVLHARSPNFQATSHLVYAP